MFSTGIGSIERGLIVASALLVGAQLLQVLQFSKIAFVESFALVLLAVWTWCIFSFRHSPDSEDKFRVLGTNAKCYRSDVDDGSFYGALLVPTAAAAKVIDARRSTDDGSFVVLVQSYYELCVLLAGGLLFHMFMSKRAIGRNLSKTMSLIVSSAFSMAFYYAMRSFNRVPLLRQFPWQFILFSQVFHHASLLAIANILKRNFSFGEMAVVAQTLTILAVEAWLITLNHYNLIDLPSFARLTRSPTTIFQLALILGMLVIGTLLSPILMRSRRLGQQPTWKNNNVRVVENEKKVVAVLICCGTAFIAVAGIGQWAEVMLKANPYMWIINHALTSPVRVVLAVYWTASLMTSIVVYNHVTRSRRSFSLNSKRKYFHALAAVMFIPGYLLEPEFMNLSFSVALAGFIFLEYLRFFAVYPFGKQLHIFMSEFLDNRDCGPCILSHIYLLVGCAGGVWIRGSSTIAALSGMITLGLGDAMASIIGRRYGKHRWPTTTKTVEGTMAFIVFDIMGAVAVSLLTGFSVSLTLVQWIGYIVAVGMAALLEAFSFQNDNLVIPLYLWPLVTLIGPT